MAFTTRVELHNATYSDYETLHESMRKEGFNRTIRSDDGIAYHLPTAEYDYPGNATRNNVLERAKRAAATTGKSAGVLVSEATGRTWSGLPKV
jgi:hypothetical protein